MVESDEIRVYLQNDTQFVGWFQIILCPAQNYCIHMDISPKGC